MWKKIVAGFLVVFAMIAFIRVASNNSEPFHIRSVLEYLGSIKDLGTNPITELANYIGAAKENMIASAGAWYNPFATVEYYLRAICSPILLIGYIVRDGLIMIYNFLRIIGHIMGF